MGDLSGFGRTLIIVGAFLAVVGVLVVLFGRALPGGRLPGDFVIARGPVSCFLPLATSLLLSVILTILLNLWVRR